MIISVSRRTDIPSYYSEWFFNRLKDGYAYVRNPMNPHQISEVSLSPDVVDGIVFWTKNPTPMLNRLDELQDYTYYFQFTLTPYGVDIEKNIPSKNKIVIPTFQKLSTLIGKDRVIWRYDPILLNDKYTLQYHMKYFRVLCDKLAGYTEKCTISFLDLYKNILSDDDIRIECIEGKRIIVIAVPSAQRRDRPVYMGGDLYHGSYYREGDGDYRLTRDEVDVMLRGAEET